MSVRHLLLAAALLLPAGAAQAARFTATGAPQSFTATRSGDYRIVAHGAPGGGSYYFEGGILSRQASGGSGGVATGLFHLDAGTLLTIIVGGPGQSFFGGGGGGGATWIFAGDTPYLIAGGGGGAISDPTSGIAGEASVLVGGSGAGGVSWEDAGAGAGWFGNGTFGYYFGGGGQSRPSFDGGLHVEDLRRGASGGYGGGGASTSDGIAGAGGGGYTGGNVLGGPGSAGTSYVAPFALGSQFSSGSRAGLAVIAAIPEPESWALLVIGFGVVGGTLRARRRQLA